jgi:hypothetical protein
MTLYTKHRERKRGEKEEKREEIYFFGALNMVSKDVFSCSLVRVSLST